MTQTQSPDAARERILSREWWQFIPEDQRALYEKAGFSKPQSIEGKPALVVIDTVVAFTGSRPMPVSEAVEEFATSCGEAAWQALPAIEQLLEAFRAAELPVVFTKLDLSVQYGARGATKRTKDDRIRKGNDFLEQVSPREDEWVCEKGRASAFYGTPLDAYLRTQGVGSVVLVGGSTSGCVRASCADAYSAGFQVVVVEDGCFDRARHPHLGNLFDMHAKYGTVMTSAEVLEQVRA
jgi:maleamate amidohydrolase